MKPRYACALLFALCLALAALPAPAQQKVYALWTKAALFDAAAVHASKLGKDQAKYARYVDLAAVAPKDRARGLQALGYVVNSLSRSDQIAVPLEVHGTEGALAYVDLAAYRIDPAAFDRLGELGSGPAPFPEPYYHLVVDGVETAATPDRTETYTEKVRKRDGYGRDYTVWDARSGTWNPEYETVTRVRVVKGVVAKKPARKVLLGPHLHEATALGLTVLTQTAFPVYEFHWFCFDALVEPRYHELLGLDDSVGSVDKLAAVDEEQSDRLGSTLRGAVLLSEVAHRNRALLRRPTPLRYGKGSIHKSKDFKTSVRRQDVMKDLLGGGEDANEIIWNLPNGLLGFFVTDAAGRRLDKADADVALNNRSRFSDRQVRTALHCIACHLPDRGWIEIDDEVRALSLRPVKLYADALDREQSGRGDRIRQQYLAANYNELLRADQAVVEVAVRAATTNPQGKSLTCPEAAKIIVEAARSYTDEPVTLARLSLELGYSQADVLRACGTEGLDPVFAVLAAGRKARRDQVESGFAALATILYKGTK